ncbi:rubrerythrin-like domain-containing protein [Salarchaeum sp. III]
MVETNPDPTESTLYVCEDCGASVENPDTDNCPDCGGPVRNTTVAHD